MVRTLQSLLVLLALWCQTPAQLMAQTPSSDVSIGIFPFLVGNMDSRISEIVSNCQSHGIDTVYVSVFRATGPLTGDLWINDSAGDWQLAWGNIRSTGAGINLPNLIAACHAANVSVVGVIKCFSETVQPDNANHRSYLLDVIDYLTDSWQANGRPVYDLDGLALDYVRFVSSTNANAQLVTNFVQSVRDRVGNLSLHAYLVAGRFTFDGPVYNASFNSYSAVRSSNAADYGQDWQQLAPLLDVLMPMAYTADGSIYSSYAAHQAYVAKTAEYARLACILAGVPNQRVVPTVKTYPSSGETTTVQTIDASIRGALLGGGDGYQSFRYQFLTTDPTWWGPMSLYAEPGCNWPKASFAINSPKLTASVDPSASQDIDQASSSLQVRFDFDGDAVFDTPWQSNAPALKLMSHPATWITTAQVKDSEGHIATTRRRFSSGSPLQLFPTVINTTTGGQANVFIDAGTAAAGQTYLVLATISGTGPGFVWGAGIPVPINPDGITTFLATNPNGGVMNNGFGTLDAFGRANAALQWPPQILSFLAGFPMHWTFIAQNFVGQPTCAADSKLLILQ